MQSLVHSEAGHDHHGNNEDCARVRSHSKEPSALLCVLADGHGGQVGGAEASQIAVEACLNYATSLSVRQLSQARAWYSVVSAADEAVSVDKDAGFTTLVSLCVFADGRIYGASCGDSAAFLVRGNGCQTLTENQRKNPPIGSGGANPVVFSGKLASGDKLLICSDGVWRYLSEGAIVEAASQTDSLEVIATLRRMQTDQNRGVLPDDFSVILVQPEV